MYDEHCDCINQRKIRERNHQTVGKSGYGIESVKNKGRQLVFQDSQKDVQYFLVKANDCITYVQHGVADIGVVGKDTLLEGDKDYYEMLDLGIAMLHFEIGADAGSWTWGNPAVFQKK